MPGLLIKPAQFLQHVTDSPGRRSSVPCTVHPEAHPVGSFRYSPDKGFARVLCKAILCQKTVQHPDGATQMMTGPGEYQKVIHKAGIAQVWLLLKMAVDFRQMKGGQQGTQGRSAGYAFSWRIKRSPFFRAVVNKLVQQIAQHRMVYITAELFIQKGMVDTGVISFYISPADKSEPLPGDGLPCPSYAGFAATVAAQMFTMCRNWEQRAKREGERGDDSGIFGRPDRHTGPVMSADK